MALAKNDRFTTERTRHVKIRYYFIQERVGRKDVWIEYMPMIDMVAIVLTKPLKGILFMKLHDLLVDNWVVLLECTQKIDKAMSIFVVQAFTLAKRLFCYDTDNSNVVVLDLNAATPCGGLNPHLACVYS